MASQQGRQYNCRPNNRPQQPANTSRIRYLLTKSPLAFSGQVSIITKASQQDIGTGGAIMRARTGLRVLLILGCMSLGSAGFAQQWASDLFETSSHDFGSVAQGAKVEYDFVLTNNFAANVHITGVQSSCGCTTPKIANPLLKPYEKGAIVAHLNSGAYLGQRHATITVTFDKPAYAQAQLQIAALVHEDVLFDPDSIELGNIDQNAGAEGKIIVYRSGRIDWKVLEAEVRPSPFVLSVCGKSPAGQSGLVRASCAAR